MIVSRKRNDTTPALADTSTNSAELLQRVFISERTLGEGWLQELIHENPSVLPAGEVRADASDLIPIGREIAVESGRIDCLYITPTGTLVLVEAKLWRNPEARREVVAQIIQYADELSRWTYEDLDRAAIAHTGRSLWNLVAAVAGELAYTEPDFHDAVSQNLERGDFLLMLVGDGIKRGVQSMAAFLQQTPHLHFTLALVELRLYKHPGDNRLLVVPSLVARVEEVQRAVVRVAFQSNEKPGVDVVVNEPMAGAPSRRKPQKLTEEEFLERFQTGPRNDDSSIQALERLFELVEKEPNLGLRYNPGGIAITLRGPNGKIGPASLLTLGHPGIVKLHSWSLNNNLEKRMSKETANRIHVAHEQGMVDLFGPDVIKGEMNVMSGDPHISSCVGGIEALIELLLTTTRAVEAEAGAI